MPQDANLHQLVPKLDPELWKQIRVLALLHRRTATEEVNEALRQYVAGKTITTKTS